MARLSSILLCVVLAILLAAGSVRASQPIRLIYDTDMQTDCDDAAALAVLHSLADMGEVEILGVGAGVLNAWSAACVDAINTYHGRPHLPLGQLKKSDGVNINSLFTRQIAEEFPQDAGSAANVPDAVTLYRQLLANEEGKNIVILSVGYMSNLAELMNSPADSISPLTGMELISQKVKTWICMGGNFPNDHLKTAISDNVNFRRHPASVMDCVANWPGEIVYVGREIGHSMRAGARLSETPAGNPTRRAYQLHRGGLIDHHCADIAAVLYAVRGLGEYWDIEATGSVSFTNATAHFQWVASPDREESYLLAKMSPATIAELLEDLMIQPPGTGQPRPAVSLVSPANGAQVGEGHVITLTAEAADTNGTIAKVEFYEGFKKIGEAAQAPFSIQWSSNLPGTRRFSAKATDNSNGSTISAAVEVRVGHPPAGGTGLTGEYFAGVAFGESRLTRVDATLNFNWGSGSPAANIPADGFSVRWTGGLIPVHAEGARSYTFRTNTNDGVRLWVDGQLIVDDWTNGPLRTNSGSVVLQAGIMVPIRMEYYENTNTSQAELRWESADLPLEIVPATQLFPRSNRTPEPAGDEAEADMDLPALIRVLDNDVDPDSAPAALAIQSVEGGAAGAEIVVSGDAIVYTPPAGYLGSDTFQYTVSDGQAAASANVVVTVRPWETFEAFQRRYFTEEEREDPSISDWAAAPSKDGVPNAIKYAQGIAPGLNAKVLLPAAELRAGQLVMTYRKRKAANDHFCVAQVSGDLADWKSGPGFTEETVIAEDAIMQVIESRDVSAAEGGSRFIRLSVERLP